VPIVVSNVFPPDRGGIQTMMAALASIIAQESKDVVVVAPSIPGSDVFDKAAPYRIIRFPIVRRPFDAGAMLVSYLRALGATHDRSTLLANWWPTGLPLLLLSRRIRGKTAVFAHGADVAPRKAGLRRILMRYAFSRADAVLANSDYTKALLARAGITKNVRVVPLGVDMAPIDPAPADCPTILSVGRLIERKGFDRMIESLVTLVQRFPTVRYEIVGDGPDMSRLRELARRLDVDRYVVFHGKLGHEDMRAAYARAWCFALPVRAIGSDVEGFGIVYLEAAMAHLPSIGGIDSGATDAIVEGVTGYLVNGDDRAAVSNAVATVLANPEEARRMGERGFERAKDFTWRRTLDECMRSLGQ
jgi:phosphatidylinositol alpha-1,6-mannosyltransferase